MDVFGRGKQRGMKVGEIVYDELPKELILTVVKDSDQGAGAGDDHEGGPHRVQGCFRRRQDLCFARGGSLHDQQRRCEKEEVASQSPLLDQAMASSHSHAAPSGCRGQTRNHPDDRSNAMKEVLAVIRMNKINATKRALSDAGISSITARKVLGRGVGKVDYLLLQGAQAGYRRSDQSAWVRAPN